MVQWDEDGNPRNVVQRKNVTGVDGQGVKIGKMCSVRVREGAKMVPYSAKLLCSGKCLIIHMPHAQALGDSVMKILDPHLFCSPVQIFQNI